MENKTLFGELPLGWKHVALSDVTTFISRGRQPKYIASVEGIPVINQKMIRNLTIDYRYVKYNDAKKNINKSVFIKIGDTLVNSTGVGTVGRSAYISIDPMRPTFVDSHVTIVRPDTAIVDPKFMSVVLSSDVYSNYMGSTLAQGSTGQVELSRQKLSKMCIPFPPLNTQHLIGTIFDLIDQKIKLNHQINKNLQKLKDDIWISQRVDKKTSLSNLMTIQSGKRPIDRYDNKFRLKELYPIIGANGVMGWTSKALTAGTIITTGRVGTHGVVNMFDEPVWVSDNSFVISSKYEEVAYEILRCDVKFLTLVHGTTQPLITQKDLKQYVVSIPSNNQLKKVNEHLKVYTNLINVNNKQNKFLTALRNLLLPKLLSGEIDLSDVKEVIQGD
ncbi:restriction endonuclease subunit S [Lacticaseibacillus paracasei]|uniref:restriction endonuclease subunit S n=1 Tax=Lacticaseibacillus paracasei TaxID=1597 RepID=UPI0029170BB7|nr:restriction endonuclease subunit S [Lacticaseibacillus paracasei]WNX21719.1 restriction endonuclease subunit S [Lacticaseibacillus paracasei]